MITYFNNTICQYVPWPAISLALASIIVVLAIALLCCTTSFFLKQYLIQLPEKLIHSINPLWGEITLKNKVISKLFKIIPAFLLYHFAKALELEETQALVVQAFQGIEILCLVYIIVCISIFLSSCLNSIQEIYRLYPISIRLPIKTYMQVFKGLLVFFTIVIIASVVFNISIKNFFAGFGAATAVISLIFRDSLLGFVASVQLNLYDIVRIGDWIIVPTYNVDGCVEDVSVSTVKVRNFDKTVTTIPTSALLLTGLQNWRGMHESGGRRIKSSIKLDINTIRFYSKSELEALKKSIPLLQDYIESKISNNNNDLENSMTEVSNASLYREYIDAYLRKHPQIHQKEFTFLIRYLEPTEKGLPIEIYVFTKVTYWITYEQIQSKILDHLLAIVSQFGLKVFQDNQLNFLDKKA